MAIPRVVHLPSKFVALTPSHPNSSIIPMHQARVVAMPMSRSHAPRELLDHVRHLAQGQGRERNRPQFDSRPPRLMIGNEPFPFQSNANGGAIRGEVQTIRSGAFSQVSPRSIVLPFPEQVSYLARHPFHLL